MSFWRGLVGRKGRRADAADVPELVDLHCHLLPGVDDGAADVEETLAMLRRAHAGGTRRIAATPHLFHPGFPPRGVAELRERFERLLAELEGRAAEPRYRFLREVRLSLGAEHRVGVELFEALAKGDVLPFAGGRHLLVELDDHLPWPVVRTALERVREAGFVPVLAHVERFRVFARDPGRLDSLRQAGDLAQVNADAVLGRSGRRFLRRGQVDVIASDGHRPDSRPPDLGEVYDALVGKGYAPGSISGWLSETPSAVLRAEMPSSDRVFAG